MEWIIALGGLGLGGVITAVVTRYLDRNRTQGEMDSLAVDTADRLILMVNRQLESQQSQIDAGGKERHIIMEENTALLRYIEYLHDRLQAYGIDLPTFNEWKREENA